MSDSNIEDYEDEPVDVIESFSEIYNDICDNVYFDTADGETFYLSEEGIRMKEIMKRYQKKCKEDEEKEEQIRLEENKQKDEIRNNIHLENQKRIIDDNVINVEMIDPKYEDMNGCVIEQKYGFIIKLNIGDINNYRVIGICPNKDISKMRQLTEEEKNICRSLSLLC